MTKYIIRVDVGSEQPYGSFPRLDIIEKLKEHRKRYVDTLDTVREIYKKQVEKYTVAYAEYTKKQLTDTLEENDKRPIPPTMPEDRRKTYDRYIAFYEDNTLPEVILSEPLYSQLYLDEWHFVQETIAHLRTLTRAGGSGAFWMDASMSEAANLALMSYEG